MRSFSLLELVCLGMAVVPLACVNQLDLSLSQHVNVVVVDGTITNLAEHQIIRLNRSKSDSLTGRFGSIPLTKALVEIVVDSTQVIACHETVDGSYQLPSDFRGQVGHSYQLRFTLSDGTHYQSTQQIMPDVPLIDNLALRFNPTSLPNNFLPGFKAGYDVLIDTKDPVNQRNYYRWEWNLYEKQDWCRSCSQGYYMTNKLKLVSSYPDILVYQTQPDLLEDCFMAPAPALFGGEHTTTPYFVNDYPCRSQCWEIIHSSAINVFTDQYTNGGIIGGKNVDQVPYYTNNPALIEVRQSSLTADAYRFLKILQEQTQNTGSLVDTPPTATIGNVHNAANYQEKVVGYFIVGAVSSINYWLDKRDATGLSYGEFIAGNPALPNDLQLFVALNGRGPKSETNLNFTITGGKSRPPTALCIPSESRTLNKPRGWQD